MDDEISLDPLDCRANVDRKEWDVIRCELEGGLPDPGGFGDSDSEDEEQEEPLDRRLNAIERALDDLQEWVPQIWTAAVERLDELDKCSKCLHACQRVLIQLDDDGPFPEIELKDASGNVVYAASNFDSLVAWIMKELLVAAWETGDEKLRSLVEEVLRDGWFVTRRFMEELLDGVDSAAESDNAHSAQREIDNLMTKIAEKKAAKRHASVLADFKSRPSVFSYNQRGFGNVRTPQLTEDLRQAARSIFLYHERGTCIAWKDAFRILSTRGTADDINLLLCSMPSAADEPSTEIPRFESVLYLLKTEGHRQQGVTHLTNALNVIAEDFLRALNTAFPGLDAACKAMKAALDSGELNRYRHAPKRGGNLQTRSENVDRFVEIALVDNDQDAGRVQRDAEDLPRAHRLPDSTRPSLSIAKRLDDWVEALTSAGLPDEQTLEIREATLGRIMKHALFREYWDFAEVLRQRKGRSRIADCIGVAYRLFGTKQPPPTRTSARTSAGRKRIEPIDGNEDDERKRKKQKA